MMHVCIVDYMKLLRRPYTQNLSTINSVVIKTDVDYLKLDGNLDK